MIQDVSPRSVHHHRQSASISLPLTSSGPHLQQVSDEMMVCRILKAQQAPCSRSCPFCTACQTVPQAQSCMLPRCSAAICNTCESIVTVSAVSITAFHYCEDVFRHARSLQAASSKHTVSNKITGQRQRCMCSAGTQSHRHAC